MAYRATGNPLGPPGEQLAAAAELLARLCVSFRLTPQAHVVGHRELLNTGYTIDSQGKKRLRKECPGMKVDLDELRRDVARRVAAAPTTGVHG